MCIRRVGSKRLETLLHPRSFELDYDKVTESITSIIAVLSNHTSSNEIPDKIPHEKPFEIPYEASQDERWPWEVRLYTECGARDLLQEHTDRGRYQNGAGLLAGGLCQTSVTGVS
jgi:hypothetical protein